MANANVAGRKHIMHIPVHNDMNARNCENNIKNRTALCHAENNYPNLYVV